MRMRVVLALCAAFALAVGVAAASARGSGGNSANAKLCQKGGWQTLIRSTDGTSFASEKDCVSFAAQGGTPTKTKAQLDCESFGGTFGLGPDLVGGLAQARVFWVCNGWTGTGVLEQEAHLGVLLVDCALDDGSLNSNFFPGASSALNATCDKRISQVDCEAFGGTYQGTPGPVVPWLCGNWTFASASDYQNKSATLAADCEIYGGANPGSQQTGPGTASTLCEPPNPDPQADCTGFGGTFYRFPGLGLIWLCTGWTFTDPADFAVKSSFLNGDCVADGGSASSGLSSTVTADTTCALKT